MTRLSLPPGYLRTAEVAALAGCTVPAVILAAHRGKLPGAFTVPRNDSSGSRMVWAIPEGAARAWAQTRRTRPALAGRKAGA